MVQTHDHILYTENCKNRDEPWLYLYGEYLLLITGMQDFDIAAALD